MKNLLLNSLVFSLIFPFVASAQWDRVGGPGHEINPGSSWKPPHIRYLPGVMGHSSYAVDMEGITKSIRKKMRFDSMLEVNTNTGSLKTHFSIKLPPNILGRESISFYYNSLNPLNLGYGAGWSLVLPSIRPNPSTRKLAPYRIEGDFGDSDLVLVRYDVNRQMDLIQEVAGKEVSIEQIEVYQASLEQNYNLYLKVNDLGWIVLNPTGKQYLLSDKGNLLVERDLFGNQIKYEWSKGVVRKMWDPALGWELALNYNEEASSAKFVAGSFEHRATALTTIDIALNDEKRTINFKYDGQYLVLAHELGHLIPLFQGVYAQKEAKIVRSMSNALKSNAKKQIKLRFYESLETPEYWEEEAPDDKLVIYEDLNGDGREDRITYELKSLQDYIGWMYEKNTYKVSGTTVGNCKAYPQMNVEAAKEYFTQNGGIKVELAIWSGSKVDYVEDRNLSGFNKKTHPHLKTALINPLFSYAKRYDSNCASVYYYTTHLNYHGLFFHDLNGDGLKDFISCQSSTKLEDASPTVTGHPSLRRSNFQLSVLKYLGFDSSKLGKFTNVLNRKGTTAKVFLQQLDERGLQRKWEEIKGTSDYVQRAANLVGYTQWKKTDIPINCHENSLFMDYNQDGTLDVITGDEVFLIGKDLSIVKETVDFSRVFESGPALREIDLGKQELILADTDSNGLLEPVQARVKTEHPLKGYSILVSSGETTFKTPRSRVKLLTQYQSSFGGVHQVDYDFKDGRYVVKRLSKDPRDEHQAKTIIDYQYVKGIKDPVTGYFLGFYETIEQEKTQNGLSEVKITKRTFSKDTDPEVRLFKSRSRVNGLVQEKTISNEEQEIKKSVFQYKIADLGNKRIYPYAERVLVTEPDQAGNISKESIKKYLSTTFGPAGPAVKSVSRGGNNDYFNFMDSHSAGYFAQKVKRYRFFPELFVNKLHKEYVLDANDKMNFHSRNYEFEEATGLVKKIITGERVTRLDHDKRGRLTSINKSNGAQEKMTYQNNGPLVSTYENDFGLFEYQYDEIRGQVRLAKLRNRRWFYQYQGDFLTSLSEVVGSSDKVSRFSAILPQKKKCKGQLYCLARSYSETSDGNTVVHYLDGFGRITNTSSPLNEKTRYSGLTLYDGDDNILTQYAPGYGTSGRLLRKMKRDSLGRIVWEKSFSFKGLERHVTYNNFCSHSSTGGLQEKKCEDGYGNLIESHNPGEQVSFKYNELGALTQATTHSYEWKYNNYGEIVRTSGAMNNVAQEISTFLSVLNRSPNNLTVVKNGSYVKERNHRGELVRSYLSEESVAHTTDIFEQRAFKYGLLSQMQYLDKDKNRILQHTVERNQADNPLLVTTKIIGEESDLRHQFAYDKYQRVAAEKIETKAGSVEFNYQYKDGGITALLPHIPELKRDVFLRLASLDFKNGVKLSYSYGSLSKRPTSIKYELGDTELYNESYEYDDQFRLVKRSSRSVLTKEKVKDWSYTDENVLADEHFVRPQFKRNKKGEVLSLSGMAFKWRHDNLVELASEDSKVEFYYNANGSLLAACPDSAKLSEKSQQCFIRLSETEVFNKGAYLQLIKHNNTPVLLQVDNKVYPVISDSLGSVKGLLDEEGELLFSRHYDAWGKKTVTLNSKQEDLARKLEALTCWSYAGLIEIPMVAKLNKNLYWSMSRVYSPELRQWLSVDPEVSFHPGRLLSNPGNWQNVRYANNDPLNFVDPSGRVVQHSEQTGNDRLISEIKDVLEVKMEKGAGIGVSAKGRVGPVTLKADAKVTSTINDQLKSGKHKRDYSVEAKLSASASLGKAKIGKKFGIKKSKSRVKNPRNMIKRTKELIKEGKTEVTDPLESDTKVGVGLGAFVGLGFSFSIDLNLSEVGDLADYIMESANE